MGTWLKIVAWLVAIAGSICLVLEIFFVEVWRVPIDDPLLAASIEPTLSAGDVIVVTRHGSVGRGDMLRCADPQAPGRFVLARALGRYGERVDIRSETVSLDGKHDPSPRSCDPPEVTLHDPRSGDDVTLACAVEEMGDMPFSVLRAADHPEAPSSTMVEAAKWFLVSDDRHVHLDSRDFGQIDPVTCQHVVFRLIGAAGFGDTRRRLTLIW
jgi:signal peptidase I